MAVAYLLLGSNIGESKEHLQNAKKYIQDCIGDIEVQSSIYATAAWGNKEQADFLNQVIKIETTLSPVDTLEKILNIELKMGRIRTEKNAARIIDIDILFFSNEILNTENLIIPHPLIQVRKFVLVPLNEIAPTFIHPVFNKTIHQMLLQCEDNLTVNKI
jgi:2-amino-4-hydroxy-6-hydroxymethyldihydropteridine diphosphokinase